jgi:hypothetical protein
LSFWRHLSITKENLQCRCEYKQSSIPAHFSQPQTASIIMIKMAERLSRPAMKTGGRTRWWMTS